MIVLSSNAYKSYALCQMQGDDFFTVKTFLDSRRSELKYIEFFYPYKDEELKAVLEHGFFWGILDDGRLIATFAIDTDDEYAERLADIINSCCKTNSIRKSYEASGLMVDSAYRGQGIASFLMKTAVAKAQELGIDICGVVHTRNYLSMSTFFSQGFALKGVWHMCDDYDFVYLLKCNDSAVENKQPIDTKSMVYTSLDDTQRHSQLLAQGYSGVTCDSERIAFAKI